MQRAGFVPLLVVPLLLACHDSSMVLDRDSGMGFLDAMGADGMVRADRSVPDGELADRVVPDGAVPDSGVSDAQGSDGAGPDGAGPDGGMGCDAQRVFNTSCVTAGCHNRATSAAGLDLSGAGNGDRFVGRSADATRGSCGGAGYLIDPNVFQNSLFIRKLEDSPVCGNRMPLVGSIPSGDRDCIISWVRAASAR